ncbi:MAG: prepilin-type N-terminal cleavage/methylation domain-containing protein [Deltaproteobacteria bacterium]
MNQRGFTLIELLIAMTMLAAIIGIMGGALSQAYQTSEKAEKKINELERKRILSSLIESQIQSAYAGIYTAQGETKNRFAGAKDAVTFASNYSIWGGTKGNCLVTYRIETDHRRKSVIRIEEQILGTDVKNETSIATDYDAIRFEYYYDDVTDEAKWVDEWPAGGQGMPQKMKIHLSDGENERVLTARIFTKTTASSAAISSGPFVTK